MITNLDLISMAISWALRSAPTIQWGRASAGSWQLGLSTTDTQATYETLCDRGVVFSEPPTAQPWGMIQGQDGNGYVLVGT